MKIMLRLSVVSSKVQVTRVRTPSDPSLECCVVTHQPVEFSETWNSLAVECDRWEIYVKVLLAC